MNKKGFGEALTLLLSVAIISLFFFMAYKYTDFGKGAEMTIKESTKSTEDNLILINYLKTPVGNKVIADLIAEYHSNEEPQIKHQIEQETNKIFNAMYGNPIRWELEIDDKKIVWDKGGVRGAFSMEQGTIIPAYDNNILKVRLVVKYD